MILSAPWWIILHHFHQESYENKKINYPACPVAPGDGAGVKSSKSCPIKKPMPRQARLDAPGVLQR